MVNKTPLRLVAIGELPEDEHDDSAAPVDVISDADAITRRVPDSEQIAAHETVRDKTPGAGVLAKGAPAPIPAPKASRRRALIVVAVGVAAFATTAIVVSLGRGKPAAIKGAAGDGAKTSVTAETPKPAPEPSLAPIVPAPSKPKVAAEIIRLEITAEPVEAELSLDGNVLAGHRLNLQVPKDHGIHVVSASAPGYVPFNQQVSFTSDVVLSISLRRGHGGASRQVATKARPSRPEVKRSEAKPAAEPASRQFGPGMHLEGPPVRAGGRQIDERNPYNP